MGSYFHPHWECIMLKRVVMERRLLSCPSSTQSHRAALAVGIFGVWGIQNRARAKLFSEICWDGAARIHLCSGSSGDEQCTCSKITYHKHQFSVKWKCWHGSDNVKTHLPNLHRFRRIVLCFQCWARAQERLVKFWMSHRLFVWGSTEDLISLHLKSLSINQG